MKSIPYVKILDNKCVTNNLVMNNYLNAIVTGKILASLQSRDNPYTRNARLPSLIRYTSNTLLLARCSGNDVKQFLPGETLEFCFANVVKVGDRHDAGPIC
jgi:hypothetical protein